MTERITYELTCINCPMGCSLTASRPADAPLEELTVTGNGCKAGITYAISEIRNPLRMVTTAMKLPSGQMLPVKTSRPIPKDRIYDCLAMIKKTRLTPAGSQITCRETVIKNILSLGVDIVATKSIYF